MTGRITRREFTSISIAAIAAPLSVNRASIAAEQEVPRIRKAVKLDMVQNEGSLHDKFGLLRQIGFDGVEIASPNNFNADEIIAARDATGLTIHGTVCSTHWSLPLSHSDAEIRAKGRAGIETALRDCHRYGGSTVLVVPGIVNKGTSYDDCYKRSQHELRSILPLAAELNSHIALENVWNNFLLSPLEAARYLDDLESPHVGWYLDVGNIVNYGWPEHWIAALDQRILKLDVKEFSRRKRDEQGLWKGFDVEIGDGDCDWSAVMRALDDLDFQGWATAEVAGGGEDRLREIHRRMNQVLTFETQARTK